MSLWNKHAIFEKNSIILTIGILVVARTGRDEFIDDQVLGAADSERDARHYFDGVSTTHRANVIRRIRQEEIKSCLISIFDEEHCLALDCGARVR